MSTTRCAAAVLRVLPRGRVASTVLAAANLLLDTGHVATALLVALAEIAVALHAQAVLPGQERREQRLHLVDVDALPELLGDRRVVAGDPDLQLGVEVEMAGGLD